MRTGRSDSFTVETLIQKNCLTVGNMLHLLEHGSQKLNSYPFTDDLVQLISMSILCKVITRISFLAIKLSFVYEDRVKDNN